MNKLVLYQKEGLENKSWTLLLIENAPEFNVTMYLCFVDYTKAFDSVKWGSQWSILSEMGVALHKNDDSWQPE